MGDSGLVGDGGDSGDGGDVGERSACGASGADGARAAIADGGAAGTIGARGAEAATVVVMGARGDCGASGAPGAIGFAGLLAGATLWAKAINCGARALRQVSPTTTAKAEASGTTVSLGACVPRTIEHLTDAAEELRTVPGCSGGENTGALPLGELGNFRQGGGVGPWRPGCRDDPIVARHFPCKRHLVLSQCSFKISAARQEESLVVA